MIRLLVAVIVAVKLLAAPAAADEMKLAVTTSFQNSGLSGILLPAFAGETGIEVRLIVVGTGQAIRLGEAGDVDAILVHSRAAEDAFIAEGHGLHRREIMYNDFVLVGPEDDPAGVAGAADAAGAFAAIARAEAPFASRGDDSGTHKRELALWESAGIDPEGVWYRALGSGMGATLNTAAGMGAYVLTDRASWLNFGAGDDMALLFEGDPALFNQYAYIPLDPARHPHVNAAAARALEEWLVSDAAQAMIGDYAIGGQRLFTPNAARAPDGASGLGN